MYILNDKVDRSILPFIMSSFAITLMLFFIDEGNYDFSWMYSLGNWLIFFIYLIPVFLMQLLISKAFRKKELHFRHTVLSIFLGSIIGLTLVMGIFFGLG